MLLLLDEALERLMRTGGDFREKKNSHGFGCVTTSRCYFEDCNVYVRRGVIPSQQPKLTLRSVKDHSLLCVCGDREGEEGSSAVPVCTLRLVVSSVVFVIRIRRHLLHPHHGGFDAALQLVVAAAVEFCPSGNHLEHEQSPVTPAQHCTVLLDVSLISSHAVILDLIGKHRCN